MTDQEFDDKEECNEEQILSILLKDEVLFCNSRDFIDPWTKKPSGKTIVLFVNCSDIFAWGCADAENLTTSDILPLYKLYAVNKTWGPAKWCCFKRNEKPQRPVEKAMREAGVWDEAMDSLNPNYYDAQRAKIRTEAVCPIPNDRSRV